VIEVIVDVRPSPDRRNGSTTARRGSVYFLVYVSSAVKLFAREELVRLLRKSRANNARNGITGMLLYKDGNFMQILEGEQAAVVETYARISGDRRHRNQIVLLRGEEDERQFPEYKMGFYDLNSPEVHGLPGYSEFLNSPLTGKEFDGDPSRSRKLLLTFKRGVSPRLD
jgi:hypothetical protein